jgi:small subunit ribosomal protein S12e
MAAELEASYKRVIEVSQTFDGLKRGLHECVKALDARKGQICFLASSCDNDEYTTLIKALAREGNVPIVEVESREKLGNWVGLSKMTKEGEIRKDVKCSVAVITDFGAPSAEYERVRAALRLE